MALLGQRRSEVPAWTVGLWVLIWGLSGLSGAAAQDGEPYYQDEPPAELDAFVPAGHEIFDFAQGDLDGDGGQDALIVARREDEDGQSTEGPPRPLLILLRQADGTLERVRRNDTLVYCAGCGGMMGDPYQGIEIKDGTFTVRHYGGSAWRWGSGYTFAYDRGRHDWFLESEHSSSFNASDPEGGEEETLTREELGDIPFESFAPLAYLEAGNKKLRRVTAARAHFYERPRIGSKPRRACLVRGDVVEEYRELRHFVRVTFTSSQGESTHGYVLKADLERLPTAPVP